MNPGDQTLGSTRGVNNKTTPGRRPGWAERWLTAHVETGRLPVICSVLGGDSDSHCGRRNVRWVPAVVIMGLATWGHFPEEQTQKPPGSPGKTHLTFLL